MSLVIRKQLEKEPETNIAHINAFPQWFKFVVDYTDIQVAATTSTVTLCTLPIKSWIHAVHWQTITNFSQNGDWGERIMVARLGDEDLSERWFSATVLTADGEGGETPTSIEDGIGLIPWEPDFDNTHDLEASFRITGSGGDFTDLDAGEMHFWFLLSSMNGGVAG